MAGNPFTGTPKRNPRVLETANPTRRPVIDPFLFTTLIAVISFHDRLCSVSTSRQRGNSLFDRSKPVFSCFIYSAPSTVTDTVKDDASFVSMVRMTADFFMAN